MKIAALILAYGYPLGLNALAHVFDSAGIDAFVHVDAKIDAAPFQECAGPRITFVPERKCVFWRGFTMVEATIQLMRTAAESGPYDRYLIISDDSLPLVRARELRSRLEMDGDHIAARIAPPSLKLRYDRFYMFDSEATQVRWLPVADREFSDDALARIARLTVLRRIGKKPLPTCFHGSQWMALTTASVERILDSWANDHWLRESFEFSEVPDEGYFHTILSQIQPPPWRPLMHVEWTGSPPPRVFRALEEISAIGVSDALFVRKVNLEPDDLTRWTDFLLSSTPPA